MNEKDLEILEEAYTYGGIMDNGGAEAMAIERLEQAGYLELHAILPPGRRYMLITVSGFAALQQAGEGRRELFEKQRAATAR